MQRSSLQNWRNNYDSNTIPNIHFCYTVYFRRVAFADALLKDEVIKMFTAANEDHLQAMKLIAEKKLPEANKKLEEAALQYEIILSKGFRHGQIHYNLGNTYYRLGEVGKAILNYRKAERLMPGNAEIKANLRLAKTPSKTKRLFMRRRQSFNGYFSGFSS